MVGTPLAEVGRKLVGSGDGTQAGRVLKSAVATGDAEGATNWPAIRALDPTPDGENGEHPGQVKPRSSPTFGGGSADLQVTL